MKTNIQEITVKINLVLEKERKHPNILANALVTFKEEEGGYFTVSGFTVWRSQYGGFNVTPPTNKFFKYFISESGFWKRLELAIIDAYEFAKIPVID